MKLNPGLCKKLASRLLVSLLALWPVPGRSQDRLSLSDAIALALDNNFQIKMVDGQRDIAALNNEWGATGALPQVNFRINTDNSRAPGTFRVSGDQIAAGPLIAWRLFDGFRAIATKDQFALIEAMSEGNAALVVENAIQAVILGYYSILTAEARAGVLDEVLRYSLERLRSEEVRAEVGAAGKFELLQFRNAVASDSANLLIQQFNVSNARRALNVLMAVPPSQRYTLTDSIPRLYAAYELSAMKERIRTSNFALRNQQAMLRLRAAEYRMARADLYPDLALIFNSNYAVGNSKLIDGRRIEQNAFQTSLGLSLDFNLYDGGRVRRAIKQATLNEDIARMSGEEMLISLDAAMEQAVEQYEIFNQVLKLSDYNVENARENLFLAEERFKSGLINAIDYRNIQVQYLNIQLARLQALLDIQRAECEITRLSGGFIR